MEFLSFSEKIGLLKNLDIGEQHLDLLDFLDSESMTPLGTEMMITFLSVLLNDIPENNWDTIRKHEAFRNISEYLDKVKISDLKEEVVQIVSSFLNLYSLAESKVTFKWGAYLHLYLMNVRELYFENDKIL